MFHNFKTNKYMEFKTIQLADLHPDEIQVVNLKKDDNFFYLGLEYKVVNPKKRHAIRLHDEQNCKFTPFTFVTKK